MNEQHIILKEAQSLVEQVEDSRKKIEHISKEHAFMKHLLVEKNRKLLEQEERIEEMTRLLVLADKMLSEMKIKIYNKEEKSARLSEKLDTIAEGQNRSLEGMKKIIAMRNEQVKKLLSERALMQKKLSAIGNAYSQAKKQLEDMSKRLRETAQKITSFEDKKKTEELNSLLKMREGELINFKRIFTESQGRIKYLEDINKKSTLQYAQEKEVLGKILGKRGEEIKKLKELAAETKEPEKSETKKEAIHINVPKTFDPFEKREMESMIKIAIAHGDTIEKIKESLLNAGYEKEKINEIIK